MESGDFIVQFLLEFFSTVRPESKIENMDFLLGL